MSELHIRRHGLETLLKSLPQDAAGNAGVTVQILPEIGHINLRGNPENSDFVAATNATLGQKLPVSANTMTIGNYRVLWLGPDEWLIMSLVADTLGLVTQLRHALSTQHASVTEVSGGQIALRVAGPGVRDVLSKGCTLDFHPDKFKVGACAQSGLAKAHVLIGRLDNQPIFEIVVRRSFAEYLVLWLRHAAGECGVDFCVAANWGLQLRIPAAQP